MSKFGVHVATWNVAETQPPKDLSALVGLPESEYVIDILAIGLQEIPWSLLSSPVALSRDNPWLQHLTDILGKSEFVLLTATQMCGSFLAIFVQRGVLPFISSVESAYTPTGFLGLFGTKGVVSVRFQLHGTWFSFVNSHFAAHCYNSLTRIWEYDTVLDYHTYVDQSKILDHDYVFWFGDMNFRLEGVSRQKIDAAIAAKAFSELFDCDQLTRFQHEGLVFTDFEESGLYFPPTYKKKIGKPNEYIECPDRLPSWCDRILYSSASSPFSIHVLDYADLPSFCTSDHTPVFLQANVAIPHTASNSLVRFGPVSCDFMPILSWSVTSSLIMSCIFSFADGFKPNPRDTVALYRKFFARLDDDIYRWSVSEFLPLRVIKLDISAEIEKPVPHGFYCLVYHHFVGQKSRVAGISDYFAIGDVNSDDDDFGEEAGFSNNGNDSSDSCEISLDVTGTGDEGDEGGKYPEREGARAGSTGRCHSARRSIPPRPKSARGHYDDLSLTPGVASRSTSNASFTATPIMMTPSLPPVEAWSASPVVVTVADILQQRQSSPEEAPPPQIDNSLNESIPLDEELAIIDDEDDGGEELIDEEDLVENDDEEANLER